MLTIVIALMAGCAPAKPTEAEVKLNCREEPALAEEGAKMMVKDGWTYAGPMYNNGVNCTAVLWVR
jgi:hypothetical protein